SAASAPAPPHKDPCQNLEIQHHAPDLWYKVSICKYCCLRYPRLLGQVIGVSSGSQPLAHSGLSGLAQIQLQPASTTTPTTAPILKPVRSTTPPRLPACFEVYASLSSAAAVAPPPCSALLCSAGARPAHPSRARFP